MSSYLLLISYGARAASVLQYCFTAGLRCERRRRGAAPAIEDGASAERVVAPLTLLAALRSHWGGRRYIAEMHRAARDGAQRRRCKPGGWRQLARTFGAEDE